jgi:UDP-N-acetylglucosamine kinase
MKRFFCQELVWKVKDLLFLMKNKQINGDACVFFKENQKELINHFAGAVDSQLANDLKLSIFMAGSPGAGKTETSKELVKELKTLGKFGDSIVRIDADEIRAYLPKSLYNGKNAHVVQTATTVGVQKLYDHVLTKNKNFILDTTLSNYEQARKNIKRALKPNRKRKIFIFFIYQKPLQAWKFTKARELVTGRRIRKRDFINTFLGAQETANKLKEEFGDAIELDLFVKDNDNIGFERYEINIKSIDLHLKKKYNRKNLLDIL